MSFLKFLGGDSLSNAPSSLFLIGRVTKIILGPFLEDGKTKDPDYNNPTDIGKIRYILHNSTQQFSNFDTANPLASPAWPSFKHFPIVSEYVYLLPGPSVALNDTAGAQDYYYLPPFGLWGAANHNAFPSLAELSTLQNIQNEISNEEAIRAVGNANIPATASISLGNDFVELANVGTLRPFIGDVLIEGRWGNSIRFGSSLRSNALENNWANATQDGRPIMILRNGQGSSTTGDPWNPTVEDINRDNSSIYLTSGQRIAITDIQNNFSLNSFGVTLQSETVQAKTIVTVPVSNDYISPKLADDLIAESQPKNIPTIPPGGGTDTEVENQVPVVVESTTQTQTEQTGDNVNIGLKVIGDKYIFGSTAVVSLRAVRDNGEIIVSITETASQVQTAYTKAVNALKATGQVEKVKIPLLNQLTRL